MQLMHRHQIATIIALAFHLSGFIAIGIFKSPLFLSLTPVNLLVSVGLIFYTQQKFNSRFWIFCILCFGLGYLAEYIGIHTQLIFGNYAYGPVLGPGYNGVPFLIGVQWLVLIYCIGISIHMLMIRLRGNNEAMYNKFPGWWMTFSIIGDGALVAVFFDWVMEPVAMALGFWSWEGDTVPWLNYYTWWGLSALLLAIFHFLDFKKHNLFAVHLLLIQFMFFLLLRSFL